MGAGLWLKEACECRSDAGRPWYGQIRAGLWFVHPVTGRRYEGVLVRWLLGVQPDSASKALDMPRVTWDRNGSQPTHDLISTDTIHGPAYLQADPLKRDHFFVNGFVV